MILNTPATGDDSATAAPAEPKTAGRRAVQVERAEPEHRAVKLQYFPADFHPDPAETASGNRARPEFRDGAAVAGVRFGACRRLIISGRAFAAE